MTISVNTIFSSPLIDTNVDIVSRSLLESIDREKVAASQPDRQISVFLTLGHFHRGQNRPDRAARWVRRALKICLAHDIDSIRQSVILEMLADLEQENGKDASAEQYYRQCLWIDRKQSNIPPGIYFRHLSKLARICFSRGDVDEASRLLIEWGEWCLANRSTRRS